MPNNLTDTEENRLLDLSLLNTDKMALMSVLGSDSTAGTEVAGGSYARQTVTWAAAASGSKANSAAVNFSSMPAVDVQGWAIYDSAGTSRKWYGLFSPKTATAQASGDTITATAHGYADGTKVVFLTGYAPSGLSANVTYFVRDSAANTFKVSATLGGAALDVTSDTAGVVVGEVLEVASGASVTIATGNASCSLS